MQSVWDKAEACEEGSVSLRDMLKLRESNSEDSRPHDRSLRGTETRACWVAPGGQRGLQKCPGLSVRPWLPP